MDTKPTVDVILDAAETLDRAAMELRHRAERLAETGDFEMAGDCISTVTNAFNNLRLDLFVIRPIREHRRNAEST